MGRRTVACTKIPVRRKPDRTLKTQHHAKVILWARRELISIPLLAAGRDNRVVKRCAIYARVSTRDKGQNPETQLIPLREFAASQGFEIAGEFVDYESGSKADRQQFRAMFDAAAKGRFKVLLFWSLDRLSREGIGPTLMHLKRLQDYGVTYRSLQEPFLDTTHEWGDLIAAFAAKLAEMERKRIKERIHAGLSRAKSQGKQLGRPKKVIRRDHIEELRAAGKSIRQIAAEMKLSKMTVQRVVAELKVAA